MVRKISLSQRLCALVAELSSAHVSFSDIDMNEVHVSDPGSRHQVYGRLGEAYAHALLQQCPSFQFFNTSVARKGYLLRKKHHTFLVSKDKRDIIEYDLIGEYDDTIIVGEVKSRSANGAFAKIPLMREIAHALWPNREIGILLFRPQLSDIRSAGDFLDTVATPDVRYVPMKYTPTDLHLAVREYYSQREQRRTDSTYSL